MEERRSMDRYFGFHFLFSPFFLRAWFLRFGDWWGKKRKGTRANQKR